MNTIKRLYSENRGNKCKILVALWIVLMGMIYFLDWSPYSNINPIPGKQDQFSEDLDFPGLQFPEKLVAQWKEHTSVCHEKTLTIIIEPGGCGYAYRCLFATVHYAIEKKRTLFIETHTKESLHWNMFFVPPSPQCTVPPRGLEIRESVPESDYEDKPNIWYYGCGCPLLNRGQNGLYMTYPLMNQGAYVIFRMNDKTKKDVYSVVRRTIPDFLRTPYNAVHVRRGDKILESKYTPTEKYCSSLDNTLDIYVASDSIDNIEEIKANCTNWTKILWLEDPRYIKLRKGPFEQAIINKWSKHQKTESFTMFLAELALMINAETFVGTGTSGVWQLVACMRYNAKSISLD